MPKHWYAHPDSTFLDDRREEGDIIWRYRVVCEWGGERFEREIDVWNPRYEPDADDEGRVYQDAAWDRLTSADSGAELSDDDADTFTDAVRELVRDDLAEVWG
jgi:hypothetical protein